MGFEHYGVSDNRSLFLKLLLLSAMTCSMLPTSAQTILWKTYYEKGIAEYQHANYKEALQSLQLALKEMDSSGTNISRASCEAGIGECYFAEGDLNSAERFVRSAIRSYGELQTPNVQGVANCQCLLAKIQMKKTRYKEAEELCRSTLTLLERAGQTTSDPYLVSLGTLCNVYLHEKRQTEAETILEKLNSLILTGVTNSNNARSSPMLDGVIELLTKCIDSSPAAGGDLLGA